MGKLVLMGTADEWIPLGDGRYQNARCPSVYRDGNTNAAYDVSGRIFVDGLLFFTYGDESIVPVTFPYVVEPQYVTWVPRRPVASASPRAA